MGKIKIKKKVRAQRKFAQGAIVPQLHTLSAPARPSTTALHRPASAPPGPVIKNNFSVTTLLNVISLRGVHESYHPTPFLVQELPPAVENESPEQTTNLKKKKFKVKDRGIKISVKKQNTPSLQRNRRISTASRASVSDSGEENQPLTYYQSKNSADTITPPGAISPGESPNTQAPLCKQPTKLSSIGKNQTNKTGGDSEKHTDSSIIASTSRPICKQAQIPVVDVLTAKQKMTGCLRKKQSPLVKASTRKCTYTDRLREPVSCTTRKTEERMPSSSSDSAVATASTSASPDTAPRGRSVGRGLRVRPKRHIVSTKQSGEQSTRTPGNTAQERNCRESEYASSMSVPDRLTKKYVAAKKKPMKQRINYSLKHLKKGNRGMEQCARAISSDISQEAPRRRQKSAQEPLPAIPPSKSTNETVAQDDGTDDESAKRVSSWISKIIGTVADDADEQNADCSGGGSGDAFKKPQLPARFRKRVTAALCPTRECLCLMSLLEMLSTEERVCGACRRCRFLAHYHRLREQLPVQGHGPAAPSDVYDFESEESDRVPERGEIAILRDTLPYWLSNFDLDIDMQHNKNRLSYGHLRRNFSLPTDDPHDDLILKLINRLDQLTQCIKQDKNVSECESSRKRLRSSTRLDPLDEANRDVRRDRSKLTPKRKNTGATATLRPLVKLTPINPAPVEGPDKPNPVPVLQPVVCLTPLDLPPEDTNTPAPAPPSAAPTPPQMRSRRKPNTTVKNGTADQNLNPRLHAWTETNPTPPPRVAIDNKLIPELDAAPMNNGMPAMHHTVEKNVSRPPQVTTESIHIKDVQHVTKKRLVSAFHTTPGNDIILVPQVALETELILKHQPTTDNSRCSAIKGTAEKNPILTETTAKNFIQSHQFTKDKNLTPFPQVVLEKKSFLTDQTLKSSVSTPQITGSQYKKPKNTIPFPQVVLEKNPAMTPQTNSVLTPQTTIKHMSRSLSKKDKTLTPFPQVLLEKNPVLTPQTAKNPVLTPQATMKPMPEPQSKKDKSIPFPQVLLEKNTDLSPQTTINPILALQSAKDKNITPFPQVVLQKNPVLIPQTKKNTGLTAQITTHPIPAPHSTKDKPFPQVVLEKNSGFTPQLTKKSVFTPKTTMSTVLTPRTKMNAVSASQSLKYKNLTTFPQVVLEMNTEFTSQTIKNNIKANRNETLTMGNIGIATDVPIEAKRARAGAGAGATSSSAQSREHNKPTRDPTMAALTVGTVVEAPIYRPTEAEFKDPIGYIERIESEASKFGICKIVPPAGTQIPYHLDQTVMFKTTNQYVGRLYQRWGATARVIATIQVLMALTEKSDKTKQPPNLDGIEVDLVKLYRLVCDRGGIQELIGDRAQWARLAQDMARTAQDGRKLEKIYIKNILPYESLSHADRMKIHSQVDGMWSERLRRGVRRASRPLHYQRRLLGDTSSSDEEEGPAGEEASVARLGKHVLDRAEECVSHAGRSNLDTFRKRAGDLQQMRFPEHGSAESVPVDVVEKHYWQLVTLCQEHVVVQTAAIDTSVGRLGHEADPRQPGGNHPWNLKRLAESPRNVLHSLGKSLSVTVPTLSLNHLFSTNCWHMDPHHLAWMDVMHEGSPKIWYAVAAGDATRFRRAMEALSPLAVQNKGLWLPSDTAMVPPALLSLHGVQLCRVLQQPTEYIVVFPGAYFSSIATGLSISESIYFGSLNWLDNIDTIFDEMVSDCEPSMFSRTALLLRIAASESVSSRVLQRTLPSLRALVSAELERRRLARIAGLKLVQDKSGAQASGSGGGATHAATSWPNQPECSLCRVPLILSKTTRIDNRSLVCVSHGLRLLELAEGGRRERAPPVTLLYSDQMLAAILKTLEARVDNQHTAGSDGAGDTPRAAGNGNTDAC